MKLLIAIMIISATVCAGTYKPIKLDSNYEHNKWGALPEDKIFKFAAFTTSFDSADDNADNDSTPDKWGIPEWVAFEIKGDCEDHKSERPSSWMTDSELNNEKLAPSDSTYRVSGTRDLKIVKVDFRFVRGHMCPKDTAERISADAAYNTHTTLNAVPQLQWQNNGIWKDLEALCIDWADKYQRVWVVCGPVFFGKEPAMWLGQDSEVRAAIPDALYKIVIRENGDAVDTLAFVIPNILPKSERALKAFLTSIDKVEEFTGLQFLTSLTNNKDEKAKIAKDLWPK